MATDSIPPLSSSPGLLTQAVQRQQIVANLSVKNEAKAAQAVADILTQSTENLAQFQGTLPRGSVLNILA